MSDEREECCGRCRFWVRLPEGHQDGVEDGDWHGRCRRFPPVRNHRDDLESDSTCYGWDFPVTTAKEDWCGEFQATHVKSAVLNEPIFFLHQRVSVRSYKCLVRAAERNSIRPLETVADLCQWSSDELLELKNFGMSCLVELREFLNAHGLRLRGDPP